MTDPVSERLALPDPLIAIVGATDDRHKYGSIIYRDLKRKGYRVAAVNPRRDTVDGDPSYHTLAELPETPDIVNVVVPPSQTMGVLDAAASIPDAAVWIQPGAADSAVRQRAEELGIPTLIDACIMVETRSVLPG
jgi:predicted CoA-binding protein